MHAHTHTHTHAHASMPEAYKFRFTKLAIPCVAVNPDQNRKQVLDTTAGGGSAA